MRSWTINKLKRRKFLEGMALTGTAAILGWRPAFWSPFHVAEPLLRKEVFTDIQYVSAPGPKPVQMFRNGTLDLSPTFLALDMHQAEVHQHPVVFLSVRHVGCFALVESERFQSVSGLTGKTVWTGSVEDNGPHIFFNGVFSMV